MIVGILGGGQLARMLALAGHPLGLHFRFLDPSPTACSRGVAQQIQGPFDDEAKLLALAEGSDVVTYEFENVPARCVAYLAEHANIYPAPRALEAGQDRLFEKRLFRELGIDTAEFLPVSTPQALALAVKQLGRPALLKTRTQGYDGKGQVMLREGQDLAEAWAAIGGVPAIVEALVPFERELSVIAVRARDGEVRCYPLSENTHRDGILRLAVSRPDEPLQGLARGYATRLLGHLDYVGVLALELFQQGERLLANEFAPRVHNSGHWTIEGAETSQFENHLRAILGLPLGRTEAVEHAAMVNFIGALPPAAEVLKLPQAHLHAYDKAPRPGRKVGHATVRTPDRAVFEQHVEALQRLAAGAATDKNH